MTSGAASSDAKTIDLLALALLESRATPAPWRLEGRMIHSDFVIPDTRDDLAFICAMRNAAPALIVAMRDALAEIKTLRRKLERKDAHLAQLEKDWDEMYDASRRAKETT